MAYVVITHIVILLFVVSGSHGLPFVTEAGNESPLEVNGTVKPVAPFQGDWTVEPGATIAIFCSKPATEPGQVIWDREVANSGTIAVGGNVQQRPDKYSVAVEDRTQTLTITDVQIEDAGVYRCYTLFNQDYDRTTLNVVVPPAQIEVTVTPRSVNEDSYATIKCIAGPSKPVTSLKWTIVYPDGSSMGRMGFESDQTHSNGTVSRTSELNILMTRDLYAASFVCDGTLAIANFSETKNVTIRSNLRPDVPYLSGFQDDYIAGQRVALSCTAPNGRPEADITWFWDGSATNGRIDTKQNENGSIDTTSTLIFDALPQHNNNFFVCSVTNKVMSDKGEQPIRINSTLVVKYKPQLIVDTTPQTAFEGTSLVLPCQSSGFPEPIVSTWLHNGYPVVNNSRRAVSGGIYRPTLYVASIDSTDKGTYQCESTNEVGTSVSDVIPITVLHAPVCKSRKTRKYGAAVSGTVEITCWIEAFPNNGIIFGWNYNGSWEIVAGQHDPLDPDLVYSKLNFTVGHESDYKDIECKADNGVGNMEQSCIYQILPPGPASAPNDCRATNVTTPWVSVDCWEEFDGGSPPSYILEAAKEKETVYTQIGNSSVPDFSVLLLPNTTYYLRVCATNRDYWQSYECGQNFRVDTPHSNDTVTEAPSVGAASAPYIAVGVLVGLLLIAIIVIAVVIAKKKSKGKDLETPPPNDGVQVEMRQKPSQENLDESYTLASDPKVTRLDETPDGAGPKEPPTYSQVNKSQAEGQENASFAADPADMGEPLYDSADGITGIVSAVALADLVLQAVAEEESRDPENSPNAGFENAALVIDEEKHTEVEADASQNQVDPERDSSLTDDRLSPSLAEETDAAPPEVSMVEPEAVPSVLSEREDRETEPESVQVSMVEPEADDGPSQQDIISALANAQTEDIIDALREVLSSVEPPSPTPPEKPQRRSSDDNSKL